MLVKGATGDEIEHRMSLVSGDIILRNRQRAPDSQYSVNQCYCHKTPSMRRTEFQNFNVSRLVLQVALSNPLELNVKSTIMKM